MIEVSKAHRFSRPVNGFQISPYMQERMVYAGQTDCYSQCNEILGMFLNTEVSVTQVQRVLGTYGGLLEEQRINPDPQQQCSKPMEVKAGEVVYAEVDGSMILTRERGWSEVKVGRIFRERDCLQTGVEHGWIRQSRYEAYLGGHRQFCQRFEELAAPYEGLRQRLVFITDGAVWIRHWLEDAYPEATSWITIMQKSIYVPLLRSI